MTEDRMRELFREMRDEPIPADSLARVRMRVAERTQSRRSWWWALIPALACALVVVLWLRLPDVPAAPIVALHTDNPLRGYVPPQPEPPPHHVSRKPKRSDVLVRIETPDPDVVLFFVGSAE